MGKKIPWLCLPDQTIKGKVMKKGFTLIEVLVTSVIVSFIFVGVSSFLILSGKISSRVHALTITNSYTNIILTSLTETIREGEKIYWDDSNPNKFKVVFKGSKQPVLFEYNQNEKSIYRNGNRINSEDINVNCVFDDSTFYVDAFSLYAINIKVDVSTKVNKEEYSNGFTMKEVSCRNNKMNLPF
ncbi:MAG: hypothetical protein CR982_00560 [Candidatus Cloacimonadota bacterium]|nr:MAG: hypothetical protein CR982_00560 [Candidatus Cloacimonadota bacterium]PIE78877.1 MAG: hypothetical protein CSA15_05660 [Candidatus Delongbacteria bacterium]